MKSTGLQFKVVQLNTPNEKAKIFTVILSMFEILKKSPGGPYQLASHLYLGAIDNHCETFRSHCLGRRRLGQSFENSQKADRWKEFPQRCSKSPGIDPVCFSAGQCFLSSAWRIPPHPSKIFLTRIHIHLHLVSSSFRQSLAHVENLTHMHPAQRSHHRWV